MAQSTKNLKEPQKKKGIGCLAIGLIVLVIPVFQPNYKAPDVK